jgi:hypothetical protein
MLRGLCSSLLPRVNKYNYIQLNIRMEQRSERRIWSHVDPLMLDEPEAPFKWFFCVMNAGGAAREVRNKFK